jgi:hypothetical protein
MASLDKRGRNYFVRHRDEHGKQRTVKGGPDKSSALRIKRNIENQAMVARAGLSAASDPFRIIETLLGASFAQALREAQSPLAFAPVPSSLDLIEDQLVELEIPSSCVYFLLRAGTVVYVGQSNSIHSRISQHRTDKEFDRVLYMPVPAEELDIVEDRFISALKPPYNRRGIGFGPLTLDMEGGQD